MPESLWHHVAEKEFLITRRLRLEDLGARLTSKHQDQRSPFTTEISHETASRQLHERRKRVKIVSDACPACHILGLRCRPRCAARGECSGPVLSSVRGSALTKFIDHLVDMRLWMGATFRKERIEHQVSDLDDSECCNCNSHETREVRDPSRCFRGSELRSVDKTCTII